MVSWTRLSVTLYVLCLSSYSVPRSSFRPPADEIWLKLPAGQKKLISSALFDLWFSNSGPRTWAYQQNTITVHNCLVFAPPLLVNTVFTHPSHYRYRRLWQIPWPRGLRVKTHTQRRGAGRGGAERPAACDLIRGNKAVDLFPRIKSQAAGRCMCVFTLRLAVTRLLGLRVWIPPGAWMFVSRECCLL